MDQEVILVVDDSEDDVLLIQKAFRNAGLTYPIQIVNSGEEAVAYLQGDLHFANRSEYPLPALVLLDLKMQGLSGFDVLQWIRQQPTLSNLRVVVLTSSDHIRDVNEAYQLGANSFMVKPSDFENYQAMSESIKDYWLRRSRAPEVERPALQAKPKRQH